MYETRAEGEVVGVGSYIAFLNRDSDTCCAGFIVTPSVQALLRLLTCVDQEWFDLYYHARCIDSYYYARWIESSHR